VWGFHVRINGLGPIEIPNNSKKILKGSFVCEKGKSRFFSFTLLVGVMDVMLKYEIPLHSTKSSVEETKKITHTCSPRQGGTKGTGAGMWHLREWLTPKTGPWPCGSMTFFYIFSFCYLTFKFANTLYKIAYRPTPRCIYSISVYVSFCCCIAVIASFSILSACVHRRLGE
jgi:hypothetical protein